MLTAHFCSSDLYGGYVRPRKYAAKPQKNKEDIP